MGNRNVHLRGCLFPRNVFSQIRPERVYVQAGISALSCVVPGGPKGCAVLIFPGDKDTSQRG